MTLPETDGLPPTAGAWMCVSSYVTASVFVDVCVGGCALVTMVWEMPLTDLSLACLPVDVNGYLLSLSCACCTIRAKVLASHGTFPSRTTTYAARSEEKNSFKLALLQQM